jgi:hypothetical protein
VNQLLHCQVHPIEYLLVVQVASFSLSQYLSEEVYRSLDGLNVAFFLSLYNYSHVDHLGGSYNVQK